MAYASGKWALGLCDYCAWSYKLHELKPFILNQVDTGLKLCPSCWTPDQPQLQVGKNNKTPEAIALYKPRSDSKELPTSRGFFGWNPVLGLQMQVRMGQVTAA